MIRLLAFLLANGCLLSLFSQNTFTTTYGGSKDEHAMAVLETQDGDYVIAGFSYSTGKGKTDILVIKTDPYGEEVWRKIFGGPGSDWANDIIETRDGNYVIAGYTQANPKGKHDAWVCQLNRYGELMWEQTYGGEETDEARSVVQTWDGGFAVAGFTESQSKGKGDIWVLRLNAVGTQMWAKNYGGKGIEKAYDILETRDGGFLLGGFQYYSETAEADLLLVRLDRHGKGLWRKVLRGPGNAVIESLTATPSGQFMVAGWAHTPQSGLDGKLLLVNATGRVMWEKTYGGKGKNAFYDIAKANSGGYVLTGQTAQSRKSANLWVVKVNNRGEMEWEKTTKGGKEDFGHALAATQDGGYALAGGTASFGKGGTDMYLLKTDAFGNFGEGNFAADLVVNSSKRPPSSNSGDGYKPNLYILSIGVSRFQDNSVNLTFAHTDASSVADRFASQEGKLYGQVKVKKLLNDQATLVNIKTGIAWLEQQATQKDMVLIFISSHGALDHKGSLYILPYDFEANNLFATGLNIRDLTEGINGAPCKKLIFLDACHSGQSGYDLLEFASIKSQNLNQAVSELVDKEAGVTVMTSSSGKEFSYENPKWGHGAFTKAILEGLNGAADFSKDGMINLMELNLYVMERVKELTQGRQHPYIPINLFGNIPLFVQ
ncbi:MAG: caspase family protein [Bacteroidota bacterium]